MGKQKDKAPISLIYGFACSGGREKRGKWLKQRLARVAKFFNRNLLTDHIQPSPAEREREREFKLESFEVRVIKDCTARGRNWYVAWGRNEIGDGPNIIEPALSGLLDNSVVNSKLVKLDTVLRTFNVNRHTPGSTIVSNSERWFDNWYGSPIVDRITRMDLIVNRI